MSTSWNLITIFFSFLKRWNVGFKLQISYILAIFLFPWLRWVVKSCVVGQVTEQMCCVHKSKDQQDCQISRCVLTKILKRSTVLGKRYMPNLGAYLLICCNSTWGASSSFLLGVHFNILQTLMCLPGSVRLFVDELKSPSAVDGVLVLNSLSDENYSTVLERHCKPRRFATCWMFHCADAVCANPVT